MKVYHGIENFTSPAHAVVTTGTFDGVHIGHQKIIRRLIEVAKQVNGESIVFTFSPHPRKVLQPDSEIKMLCTQEEKIHLLEQAGVDHLIIFPFSKEFSRTSSLEFVRDLLVNKIGTQTLVIGYDHHFGRNREGSFDHLLEYGPTYGFNVEEIPALDVDHINVSSTKIRRALLEGDIYTAKTYLSYDYSLAGTVIEGKKIGRELGFPTANVDIQNHDKLIPLDGAYAVKVELDQVMYNGMLNIGSNPTVNASSEKYMEVNIFDFNDDIYGKEIKVVFKARLRDEFRFNGVDALKEQLEQDKKQALRFLL